MRAAFAVLCLATVVCLAGCGKKSTPTQPGGGSGASVVFDGWYSIQVVQSSPNLETASGYAKNVGSGTAYSVSYVLPNGVSNPVSPTTIAPGGRATFSITIGTGTEAQYTPTFTWQ